MGSSKQRAAERARQWWQEAARSSTAHCDKCNAQLYRNSGYLSVPVVGILADTPDLLCESCYDRAPDARPFEGPLRATSTRVIPIGFDDRVSLVPDFRPTASESRQAMWRDIRFGVIASVLAGLAAYGIIAAVASAIGYSLWSMRHLALIGFPVSVITAIPLARAIIKDHTVPGDDRKQSTKSEQDAGTTSCKTCGKAISVAVARRTGDVCLECKKGLAGRLPV